MKKNPFKVLKDRFVRYKIITFEFGFVWSCFRILESLFALVL